jgi:hypothetical protein
MRSSKMLLFAVGILFLLVLSGCIKANYHTKIEPTGLGTTYFDVDVSGLASLGAAGSGLGGSGTDSNAGPGIPSDVTEKYSKETICDTLNSSDSGINPASGSNGFLGMEFTDFSCEGVDLYKARFIAPPINLVEKGFLKMESGLGSTKYTFSFSPDDVTASSSTAPTGSIPGLELTYTIEMPGEMVSANVGTISEDKKSVKIDFLKDDLSSIEKIEVVSQETNHMALILPILGGIILLLLILYFLFGRKKNANGGGASTPAPKPMSTAQSIPGGGTPAPVSMSPPPVQKVMEQNQTWGQKATIKPDPFSSEPKSEAEAKAKQVMQLLPYVRQYRQQGFTNEEISALLSRNGWPGNLIQIAMEHA